MNERIKKLAFSSGLVRNGDQGMKRWEGPRSDSINDQDLQLFAELIVRECAAYIDDNIGYDDCNNTYPVSGGELKDHFGVEE